jgi:hypothetical protein
MMFPTARQVLMHFLTNVEAFNLRNCGEGYRNVGNVGTYHKKVKHIIIISIPSH